MNIAILNGGIERQVGTGLEDIRDDHKERYLWASERLKTDDSVLDAGCGVGYGSTLLAKRAGTVHAIDISEDAVAYARKYWSGPNISHSVEDLCFFGASDTRRYDAIVAFEVVEHLIEPRLFLFRAFEALKTGGRIFVSVPNEKVIAHTVNLNPFHLKHYTPDEARELLLSCGFEVRAMASQNTREIVEGDAGRFLVLEAKRLARRPSGPDFATLSQQALTQAANHVVARAMAIHKALKDVKALKQRAEEANKRLEDANKSLAQSEPRSETQLKLLQFVESLQAQNHSSKDVLVGDLMRRVRELEAFERELRERVTQAELQRASSQQALRYEEQKSSELVQIVERVSSERDQARDEIQGLLLEGHRLKDELRLLELQRARAEDAQRHSVERVEVLTAQLEQVTTAAAQAEETHLTAVTQLEQALREQSALAQASIQQAQQLQSDLSRAMEAEQSLVSRHEQTLRLHAEQMEIASRQGLEHQAALEQERAQSMQQRQELQTRIQETERLLKQARQELATAQETQSKDREAAQQWGKERDALNGEIAMLGKRAADADRRRKEAEVRLLVFSNDTELVTEANNDLLQKLRQAEAEITQLTRTTQSLRAELKVKPRAVAKTPPTLGGVYKKLRAHRFYLPFFYRAVRNTLKNQVRRAGVKG